VTGNAPQIAAAVAAGDLDLGIVALPIRARNVSTTPFHEDALVAGTPRTAPWLGRRAIRPRDLADVPLILYERGGAIRAVIDGWFRRAGVTPRIAMEPGNAEAIKKLVEAGLGVSVGSAITVSAEARTCARHAIPLEPRLVRRLAVVRRRDRPVGPALATVLAALARARRVRAPA
jgi:DNA-binding transcriptional LysR family regulator